MAAMLAIGVVAQALAWALSDVSMRRNRTDDMTIAVVSDPNNYRVVLLGDSITRNATARYALGSPGEVANLATHAYFGMAGELLLLQRYLSNHTSPQYVVLAYTPTMYHATSDIRLIRYYLWYTFKHPHERSFLRTHIPGIDQRDWLPAAADLQVRIVEPLFSLLKQEYLALRHKTSTEIGAGSETPDPDARTDSNGSNLDALKAAISEGLQVEPTSLNAEVLRRLCELSIRYGFHLKIVFPPVARELEDSFAASGALTQLRARILEDLATCHVHEIFDFNKLRTYTSASFHVDMIHLYGDGWEQRYASDLRDYLRKLAERPLLNNSPSARNGP
jgi:hypothetical protein